MFLYLLYFPQLVSATCTFTCYIFHNKFQLSNIPCGISLRTAVNAVHCQPKQTITSSGVREGKEWNLNAWMYRQSVEEESAFLVQKMELCGGEKELLSWCSRWISAAEKERLLVLCSIQNYLNLVTCFEK